MKAGTSSAVILLMVMTALSGCATTVRPMAAAEAQPLDLVRCERVTGSRIHPTRDRPDCTPVGYPFKSFSQAEIEATGEMDLNKALRQLDPAFR